MITEDEKCLIISIAKKFYNVEFSDLFQAGWIGLYKAKKNYKENPNTKFSTYAYKYIFGEMYELTNKSKNIKISKEYLNIYKRIEKSKQILSQKLNKIPSINEISLFLEIDEKVIYDVISSTNAMLSLDIENDLLNDSNLYEFVGNTPDYDTKILVNDSLEKLNKLEKKIIYYRYFKDYTQSEIASMLGLSQVKVSRVENLSKKKIKEYIIA